MVVSELAQLCVTAAARPRSPVGISVVRHSAYARELNTDFIIFPQRTHFKPFYFTLYGHLHSLAEKHMENEIILQHH